MLQVGPSPVHPGHVLSVQTLDVVLLKKHGQDACSGTEHIVPSRNSPLSPLHSVETRHRWRSWDSHFPRIWNQCMPVFPIERRWIASQLPMMSEKRWHSAHHRARIPETDHAVIRKRSSSYPFAPKLVSVGEVDGAVLLAFQ